MSHTPGPWRLTVDPTKRGAEDYYAIDAGKGYHEPGTPGFGITGFLEQSDALLISAAPELLEALKDAVRLYETYGLLAQTGQGLSPGKWVGDARAAIAKAEGRT